MSGIDNEGLHADDFEVGQRRLMVLQALMPGISPVLAIATMTGLDQALVADLLVELKRLGQVVWVSAPVDLPDGAESGPHYGITPHGRGIVLASTIELPVNLRAREAWRDGSTGEDLLRAARSRFPGGVIASTDELAGQRRGAIGEPEQVTRARVAVGGSLHGRVLRVPVSSSVIYCDRGIEVEVVRDGDGAAFRATARFELYEVRDQGRTGLLIAADLLKSAGTPIKGNGLNETIVEALGLAAGVDGTSPHLVRKLIDEDAVRRAHGFGPTAQTE